MRRLGIALILAAALFLAGFSAGRAASRSAPVTDGAEGAFQPVQVQSEAPLPERLTGWPPTAPVDGASQLPPGPAAASAQPTAEPAPATPGTAASKSDTKTAKPSSATVSQSRSVSGTASWYCGHGSACTAGYAAGGLYAAAGPALRVGAWRGRYVTVTANGHSVRVRLVDWCGCPGGRVIDLYSAAFAKLAPLSAGVVRVTVRW